MALLTRFIAIVRRPSVRCQFLLLFMFAAAILVRLPRLTLSVSGDEPFTLYSADLPWTEMNRELIADIVHPPLHYYLLHGWFRVFGFSVQQARLVSLIFGVLAVPVLYPLARY